MPNMLVITYSTAGNTIERSLHSSFSVLMTQHV